MRTECNYSNEITTQAIRVLFWAGQLILHVVGNWMSSIQARAGRDTHKVQHLVEVAPARARVLCHYTESLGENDERYRFCQWCSRSRIPGSRKDSQPDYSTINQEALAGRCAECRAATAEKTSVRTRERRCNY